MNPELHITTLVSTFFLISVAIIYWVFHTKYSLRELLSISRGRILIVFLVSLSLVLIDFYNAIILFLILISALSFLESRRVLQNSLVDNVIVTRFITIISLSAFILICIHTKTNGVNGFSEWTWLWREQINGSLSMLFIAYAIFLLGLFIILNSVNETKNILFILALFVIASFLFAYSEVTTHGDPVEIINKIVNSPLITSYYTDAKNIGYYADLLKKQDISMSNYADVILWMGIYSDIPLNFHSITHPPGPILFYYFFIYLTDENAPVFGVLAIAIISSLGPVVIYYFSTLWQLRKKTRLIIAAFYVLMPGARLFFPQLDIIYPLFSMTVIYLWIMALKHGYRYAFAMALVVFFMTMISYKLLIIGAFLVLYAVYHIKINNFSSFSIYYVLKISLFIISLILLFYGYLHLWTNFDPIVAFNEARHWQSIFDKRTYSSALVMNLYDFSLGMGYIPILLFFYYLFDATKSSHLTHEPYALSWIGIITIFIINITGLTNLETARIWLLLQPLVLIPAVTVVENWGDRAIYSLSFILFCMLSLLNIHMTLGSPISV